MMGGVAPPSKHALEGAAGALVAAGFRDVAARLLGRPVPARVGQATSTADFTPFIPGPAHDRAGGGEFLKHRILLAQVLNHELLCSHWMPSGVSEQRSPESEFDQIVQRLLENVSGEPHGEGNLSLPDEPQCALSWAPSLCWRHDVPGAPLKTSDGGRFLYRNGITVPGWIRLLYRDMDTVEQEQLLDFLLDQRRLLAKLADESESTLNASAGDLETQEALMDRVLATMVRLDRWHPVDGVLPVGEWLALIEGQVLPWLFVLLIDGDPDYVSHFPRIAHRFREKLLHHDWTFDEDDAW